MFRGPEDIFRRKVFLLSFFEKINSKTKYLKKDNKKIKDISSKDISRLFFETP